ncbi:MAG: excinuclease ABC subunit UvrB [Eubacteriales bacterium]|nr:excinuclease ABC subunit UvrB [Eubacteriales bacterium]MDD4421931.1 excinuclease ABC subunit UvrB [Eubacteriales bacterium]
MADFKLKSDYKPTGDQPEAIELLSEGIRKNYRNQTLVGVTGSGKTFTMANIIANINRPTLVLAHNKTLAAQLCAEFRALFPENAVEFFVSYYDYYQPEAYVPGKDVYIEKDSSINDEIDKLRHSATSALFERRDVIIVSSVSCIYSLGDPNEYHDQVISLRPGLIFPREEIIKKLVALQYTRSDIGFERNNFRVRGDVIEIFPSNTNTEALRVELFGDEIERVSQINTVTGEAVSRLAHAVVYPATHYVTNEETRKKALEEILAELDERIEYFESNGKLLEAQRIKERVLFDVEQIKEIGFCSGVENYSRVLSGRAPGSTPYTLMDYFPKDYIMFIDESHVTVPQVRGMSGGDYSRKKNLIDYGFRLPSAYDNRPLRFDEFNDKRGQTIYVSATPNEYEKNLSKQIVEQIIRPTGLLDPVIEVRPVKGQIDDLLGEIRQHAERKERVLVTTLTKKMAEDLSEYLELHQVRCRYMHFGIDTIERIDILKGLRTGEFDVLVGINLLREGLDLPEVSLVAILDADKEGFLRSETSLIQTVGRAARNENGKVIMYADTITGSMERAIRETNRRRKLQNEYNLEHGIVPRTIIKEIRDNLEITSKAEIEAGEKGKLSKDARKKLVEKLTAEMKRAAKELDFETAAAIRDRIKRLY